MFLSAHVIRSKLLHFRCRVSNPVLHISMGYARLGRTIRRMDEIEKYKRFCICCCKPLKDKYRLMKTGGRLTIVGEAFVYAAEHRWKIKLVSHVLPYLTVINVQKATKNVDTRTRALRDKVSSSRAFFQARNERVVSRAHCNPLRVWWLHLQPRLFQSRALWNFSFCACALPRRCFAGRLVC